MYIFGIKLILTLLLEAEGWLSDQPLHEISQIPNTYLFTGIGYNLVHPYKPQLRLAWINDSGTFQFTCSNSWDKASLFYLVPSVPSVPYFSIRNSVTGDSNLAFKCHTAEEGETCIATGQNLPFSSQVSSEIYNFLPRWATQNASDGISDSNFYEIIYIQGRKATYSLGSCDLTQAAFRFEPVIKLESSLVSLNETSPPYDDAKKYLPNPEEVWRETVLNPTSVTREKEIKSTIIVTNTKTFSTDSTTETLIKGETKTVETEVPKVSKKTSEEYGKELKSTFVKLDQTIEKEEHIMEVSEVLTIPNNTCAEIVLITEKAKEMVQNVTAYLAIGGKMTRFTSLNGISRESMWVPGVVVEKAMNKVPFDGKYIETRQNDVVYEIPGKLTTKSGIHTSFIVREINCFKKNM